jgi:hypothetical protein
VGVAVYGSTRSGSRKIGLNKNESLLEAFLKGRWDPFVWTNVSLGYFTPVNTNFLWLDQPSIQARFQLAEALGNLALMLSVHFNPQFSRVFEELTDLLQSVQSDLRNYDDIYLKFYIELMVSNFFYDVMKMPHSRKFRDLPLCSPEACVALLKCYVHQSPGELKERSPHTLWKGPEGLTRMITLDGATHCALANKGMFRCEQVESTARSVAVRKLDEGSVHAHVVQGL